MKTRRLLLLLSLVFALDVMGASKFSIPATDKGLPGQGPIRRYDWFQKLWERKRSGWAERIQTDQGALVFLGDSITQGWGDQFRGHFKEVLVANRGISGDTTRGVLIRLKEDVLSLNPKGVVILIGTNDLEEGAAPEVIAGNLKLIVTALKKHNATTPIILCKTFPSSATKKRPAAQIKKINQLYFAAVKGDPQVTVLDTWTLFADAKGDAKKVEFPDLLHPNQSGYDKWATALWPLLATHGFVETLIPAFETEAGFERIFNGKDLTGWGFRNQRTQEKTVTFDGKTASSDGRYRAINGRLVVTTPPEGRRIQQLWTTREFPKNFILKLQFRATPNADSGVFIRRPQLQCRDFTLAGPWKELKKYKPQDWNEIVAVVKDGVAHCTCNGEVLNANFKVPPIGPIGLEGDRGQMEYRNIRVKELD